MKYFNETYIKRKFMTRNEWADTYKAIHATTEEKVILKVLVRKSKEEEYINKLLKEVEILKSIKNPNLINVNNTFQYSGYGKTYYYIEGEYFKGISLEEKLGSGKFEEREAIKIVKILAEGLKEFHNRNIQFENLNLRDIFINSKNVVKADILSHLENKDFAILSQNETEEKVEEYGFDPEKNIYDLGIILYSLLAGKLIFESNNYKNQIYDKSLISIIDKATNNNLESKYRNIDRFILDLKSYLQCGELSNESYDVEKVSSNKHKRKKGNVGKTLGVCAAIVLVGGAVVYGYDLLEKNKKDVEASTTKIEKSAEPKKEDKKIEENKEDKTEKNKTEEDKTVTSTQKDSQFSENKYSNSDSKKNNTSTKKNDNSSNSLSNNNSSNNSVNNSNNNRSNNTSKPNKSTKPSNHESSGNTTTKPNEGNDTGEETPEVTSPSNDSNNSSAGSENTTPQSSDTQIENE